MATSKEPIYVSRYICVHPGGDPAKCFKLLDYEEHMEHIAEHFTKDYNTVLSARAFNYKCSCDKLFMTWSVGTKHVTQNATHKLESCPTNASKPYGTWNSVFADYMQWYSCQSSRKVTTKPRGPRPNEIPDQDTINKYNPKLTENSAGSRTPTFPAGSRTPTFPAGNRTPAQSTGNKTPARSAVNRSPAAAAGVRTPSNRRDIVDVDIPEDNSRQSRSGNRDGISRRSPGGVVNRQSNLIYDESEVRPPPQAGSRSPAGWRNPSGCRSPAGWRNPSGCRTPDQSAVNRSPVDRTPIYFGKPQTDRSPMRTPTYDGSERSPAQGSSTRTPDYNRDVRSQSNQDRYVLQSNPIPFNAIPQPAPQPANIPSNNPRKIDGSIFNRTVPAPVNRDANISLGGGDHVAKPIHSQFVKHEEMNRFADHHFPSDPVKTEVQDIPIPPEVTGRGMGFNNSDPNSHHNEPQPVPKPAAFNPYCPPPPISNVVEVLTRCVPSAHGAHQAPFPNAYQTPWSSNAYPVPHPQNEFQPPNGYIPNRFVNVNNQEERPNYRNDVKPTIPPFSLNRPGPPSSGITNAGVNRFGNISTGSGGTASSNGNNIMPNNQNNQFNRPPEMHQHVFSDGQRSVPGAEFPGARFATEKAITQMGSVQVIITAIEMSLPHVHYPSMKETVSAGTEVSVMRTLSGNVCIRLNNGTLLEASGSLFDVPIVPSPNVSRPQVLQPPDNARLHPPLIKDTILDDLINARPPPSPNGSSSSCASAAAPVLRGKYTTQRAAREKYKQTKVIGGPAFRKPTPPPVHGKSRARTPGIGERMHDPPVDRARSRSPAPRARSRSPAPCARSPARRGRGRPPGSRKSSPAAGGRSPASGGRSPAYGGRSPAYGGRSPAYGGRSPAYGGRSPAYGGRSPAYEDAGGRSPAYNTRSRSRSPMDPPVHRYGDPVDSDDDMPRTRRRAHTPKSPGRGSKRSRASASSSQESTRVTRSAAKIDREKSRTPARPLKDYETTDDPHEERRSRR